MGDLQAFIFVDVGVRDGIDRAAPAFLARVCLQYKEPGTNGLPTEAEFESARELEDALERYARKAGDFYVGRVTYSGKRFFYVYTGRDQTEWAEFVRSLSDRSGYDLRLSYREDPEHAGYHEELYPSEDDWQVINDLQVLEDLEEHGDDGSEPRKIDHWIYFESRESSIDFVKWAESDRFKEEPEFSSAGDDGRDCVRLYHHGTLKIGDISSHTIALRRKAAEFGAEYDGWETPVLKGREQ
jgi:hypothetical protein